MIKRVGQEKDGHISSEREKENKETGENCCLDANVVIDEVTECFTTGQSVKVRNISPGWDSPRVEVMTNVS